MLNFEQNWPKRKLAGQERYGPGCHRGEKARMHFIRFLAIYNIATPVTFSINALNLERGNCISKQITICSTLAKHSSHNRRQIVQFLLPFKFDENDKSI